MISAIDYFSDRILPEPNSGCWLWGGHVNAQGYGMMQIEGQRIRAHRFAYQHYVGEIPDGLCLDHLCRVRCCVNPAHLEAVTNRENVVRGISGETGRRFQKAKTHCPHGHPYSGANLYLRPNGTRECKTCRDEKTRIRYSPGGKGRGGKRPTPKPGEKR